MILVAGTAYNSSAFSVSLQKGDWSNNGGCIGDKGICQVAANGTPGDGELTYDVIASELVLTVPTSSAFYTSLDGGDVEYAASSYLPSDLSQALGFGAEVVYVPAGTYSVTTLPDGTLEVHLPYAFE